MTERAWTRGAEIDRARFAPRKLHELLEIAHRHARVRHENRRSDRDERHRLKVARHVVRHFRDQRIDRDGSQIADHERAAIRRLARGIFDPDRAVRARSVLDEHGLAPDLAKLLRNDPSHNVGRAAWRIREDHTELLGRRSLRGRYRRRERERTRDSDD
jgi:hypothetical protein